MQQSSIHSTTHKRFQRIIAMLKKEFGQIRKDKRMLPIIFIAPVLQLLFLGYAASLDVKNISFVLCDLDKTVESREFVQSFTNSGYFSMLYSTEEYKTVGSYLDKNEVSLALIIPHQFGNKLLNHESAQVQILLDGSEGSTAAIIMSYANQIIARYSGNVMTEMLGTANSLGGVTLESRAWYNPTLISRKFMVPGVFVLILLMTTMNLTAMAIVKEKEIGTLEQLLVTPLRPAELILGKLAPFIIIGFVNIVVIVLAMTYGFDIPIRGSILLLFIISSFFILTTLGIGLFVSTISDTQQQAMMIGLFGIMSPMMYLSGFVFPIENMPKLLQYLSYGIPMRYFLIVVRSITLKGSSIHELWFEAAMLLGMGVLILTASVLRFREKMD